MLAAVATKEKPQHLVSRFAPDLTIWRRMRSFGHGLSGVLRTYEGDRLPAPPEQLNPSPPRVRELRASLLDDRAESRRAGCRALAGTCMSW